MFDLSGKMALVTGASGGIGGAIVRALHAQGAHVVLSGTREAALVNDAGAGDAGRTYPAVTLTVTPTPASPATAWSSG